MACAPSVWSEPSPLAIPWAHSGCPGWSESSLGAHTVLSVLSFVLFTSMEYHSMPYFHVQKRARMCDFETEGNRKQRNKIYRLPRALITSHLCPSTLEVVGAPQMTLQQYLSILPCLPLSSGNLQTPFLFIPWYYPPISSSVFLSFLLRSLFSAELSSPCSLFSAELSSPCMWPYHLSFRFVTMVRRSSCTPIAFWILLRTSSFVT